MLTQLAFPCEGETLAASILAAPRATGVLFVTGGTQSRIGAHRGMRMLAMAFAEAGFPSIRYDRRGIGDSSGEDPGFMASGPDAAAALAAFRAHCPGLRRIVGLGLCDGATTLCLNHRALALDGLLLANPWVVEAEASAPPPAAIRARYRERLTSLSAWKRALTGGINYRKAAGGLMRAARPSPRDSLADKCAAALGATTTPARIVLASGDATAIAFEHEWRRGALSRVSGDARFEVATIDTDAHSFARHGDFLKLVALYVEGLETFDQRLPGKKG